MKRSRKLREDLSGTRSIPCWPAPVLQEKVNINDSVTAAEENTKKVAASGS